MGRPRPEHKTVSRTDGNNREDLLKKESFTDVRFGPLYNRVLLRYLAERGISSDVAVPNCREVRYTLHGKRYFAIGFRNVSDGYELRNRFFKASLSPKDISLMDNGSDTCNLFEGFIDCLSWLELGLGYGDDYLVLNSVSSLERSFLFLTGTRGSTVIWIGMKPDGARWRHSANAMRINWWIVPLCIKATRT